MQHRYLQQGQQPKLQAPARPLLQKLAENPQMQISPHTVEAQSNPTVALMQQHGSRDKQAEAAEMPDITCSPTNSQAGSWAGAFQAKKRSPAGSPPAVPP